MKRLFCMLVPALCVCFFSFSNGYSYAEETEDFIEEQIKSMGVRLSGYTLDSDRPVPQSLEIRVRTMFDIPDTEKVLYVSREIKSEDEPVIVITNNYVRYLPEKRSAGKRHFWKYLFRFFADVFYKDGYIQNIDVSGLTDSQEVPNRIHLGNFSKYNDTDNNGSNVAGYIGTRGKIVADTLSSIGKRLNEEMADQQSRFKEQLDKQEAFWNKFTKMPENKQAQFLKDNFDDANWRCHFAAALIAFRNNERKIANEELDKITELPIGPALFPPVSDKIYEVWDMTIKYEDIDTIARNAIWSDDYDRLFDAKKLAAYRKKAEEVYLKHFFEQSYNDRKLILPVKNAVQKSSEDFVVLSIYNMPSGIKLPPGHPQAGQFYIGDPAIAQRYIPLDDYQQELLNEKLREFIVLAEALGAEEVSAESVSLLDESGEAIRSQEIGARISYGVVKAGGSVEQERQRALNKVADRAKKMYRKFYATGKAPHRPENLPWFEYETEWQDLYEQRMNGTIQEAHTSIKSSNSVLMSDADYVAVNADLSVYGVGVGGTYKEGQQNRYQKKDSLEVTFKVIFPEPKPEQPSKEVAAEQAPAQVE